MDPSTTHHGSGDQPNSVNGGAGRDFILTSRNLAPYIAACGILAPLHFIWSDHRALFIDIELASFLRGIPADMATPSLRGITGDNPKAIAQYQKLLTASLDKSNIESRLAYIDNYQQKHGSLTKTLRAEVNQIDLRICAMKLSAVKRCRQIRNIAWSPKLAHCYKVKQFWASWLLETKGKHNGHHYRLTHCPKMITINRPSLTEIKTNLKNAQLAYKEAEKSAPALRQEHLKELANIHTLEIPPRRAH
jgi:hypothetical protein